MRNPAVPYIAPNTRLTSIAPVASRPRPWSGRGAAGTAFLSLLFFGALAGQAEGARTTLPAHHALVVAQSMEWTDRLWDKEKGLILFSEEPGKPRHFPRESLWYATGLLIRGKKGDDERALGIVDRVLKLQYLRPGRTEYGSFPDTLEALLPPEKPVMWKDYDPNWRQFIGTNLVVLLEDFADKIPAAMVPRIHEALRQAIEGERQEGRLNAGYTNIALMHAFLLDWAGKRLQRPEWLAEGARLAGEIHASFRKLGTFPEYNSPTYYGVDLFALALWRSRAPSPALRKAGAEMEAALWRDTARFYGPALKNLAGPYSRAYGMDLTRYASLVGLLLVGELGPERAPFPKPGEAMGHALDYPWAPLFALVRTRVPADARTRFVKTGRERLEKARIPGESSRSATAWIGEKLLIGAESTTMSKAAGGQFHPATLHWAHPEGGVGWMKLARSGKLDAVAAKDTLELRAERGDLAFVIRAPGAKASDLARDRWRLPGLEARIETDATGFSVAAVKTEVESDAEDGIELTYAGATRFKLTIAREAPAAAR